NFFNFLLSQTLVIFEQHVSANGQHHFESNEHERFRPSVFSGLPLSTIRAQKCNMWPGTFPLLAAQCRVEPRGKRNQKICFAKLKIRLWPFRRLNFTASRSARAFWWLKTRRTWSWRCICCS